MPVSRKPLLMIVWGVLLAVFNGPESALSAPPRVIPQLMENRFPVGRTFSGVKIPSYSNDVLQMVLEADAITRVDQSFLDITNLVIKFYNGEGKVETTVMMKEAKYHLASGELTNQPTDVRPTIRHEKFEMTGDEMMVDTTKSLSLMKERVRVEIPNASEFTGNFRFNK